MSSVTTSNDVDDEVLEQMLMEAQRLALQMRSTTTGLADPHRLHHDASSEHAGSFLSESDHLDHNYPHIVSCDSNHSLPEHESSRVSLNSYFEKINLQESHESRESNAASCEEKSYASVASAQQDAIAEAIKATREMEQALRALAESPSASPSARKGVGCSPSSGRRRDVQNVDPVASSHGRPSQATRTADTNSRVEEAELNNSSAHISWEKVEPIREDDEDFVPIVDYTSPRKAPFPRDDSEIKWERITSPDKDEDDYTPIADYTSSTRRPLHRSPMQRMRGAFLLNHKHHHRGSSGMSMSMPFQSSSKSARKRRRRALRALAVFLALGAFLSWVFFAPDEGSSTTDPPRVEEEAGHVVGRDVEPLVEYVVVEEHHPSSAELSEALTTTGDTALPVDEMSSTPSFEEVLFSIQEDEYLCFGLSDHAKDQVVVETQKDVVLDPPFEEEGETGPDLDSAKEELICLFGGRCSANVKERKLFARDNLELLLASLMP
jgi:hypothetical protein